MHIDQAIVIIVTVLIIIIVCVDQGDIDPERQKHRGGADRGEHD